MLGSRAAETVGVSDEVKVLGQEFKQILSDYQSVSSKITLLRDEAKKIDDALEFFKEELPSLHEHETKLSDDDVTVIKLILTRNTEIADRLEALEENAALVVEAVSMHSDTVRFNSIRRRLSGLEINKTFQYQSVNVDDVPADFAASIQDQHQVAEHRESIVRDHIALQSEVDDCRGRFDAFQEVLKPYQMQFPVHIVVAETLIEVSLRDDDEPSGLIKMHASPEDFKQLTVTSVSASMYSQAAASSAQRGQDEAKRAGDVNEDKSLWLRMRDWLC